MSNELTIMSGLKFRQGGLSVEVPQVRTRVNVAGLVCTDVVQTVGTSEEVLSLGESSVGGICYLLNLDDTNYVEVRANTGVADLVRINAGDPPACFRLAADAVPYVIANTAPVLLRVVVVPL